MTILILIPIFKRPEIVKLFAKGLKRLMECGHEIIPLCILSPDDDYFEANLRLLDDFNLFEYHNLPVGRKLNAGIQAALQFDWDYLMNFGSDNILNPEIWDLYEPYLKAGNPFFGLSNLYFYDNETKECILMNNYARSVSCGAGRMIHRKVFDKLESKGLELYSDRLDSGLDTNSSEKLTGLGFKETIINSGCYPYILDIKSRTNINGFYLMKNWIKDEKLGRYFEFENINRYFHAEI